MYCRESRQTPDRQLLKWFLLNVSLCSNAQRAQNPSACANAWPGNRFSSVPPRQRWCSVPRIWSCSCRCHKFDVLCWEINKCVCWHACEQDARESSRKGFNLEDADRHSGKNCECQRRAKKWAKKNRHKKSESEKARNLKILMEKPGFCMYSGQHTQNKAREFKDEQKILDNHVWELMNP